MGGLKMNKIFDGNYDFDNGAEVEQILCDIDERLQGDEVERDDFGQPFGKVKIVIKYEHDE